MTMPTEIQTDRLLLRQWRSTDLPAFRAMSACDEVMKYFPNKLSATESDALADRLSKLISSRGWGLWAVEERSSKKFIGFTGLHQAPEALPFSPALEIGWRLSKESWGKGFATEAAKAALDFAFKKLESQEIVSFTSLNNLASQRVMQRIGLENTESNFLHPNIPADSPLKEHVLYKITSKQWAQLSISNGGC